MNEIENFYQQSGYSWIIGVDEAGRGPLAGPVVAAAVTLFDREFESRVNDSKKMTHRQRDKACQEVLTKSYCGISAISEAAIDRCNILNATFYAMENAILQLLRRLQKAHDLLKNSKLTVAEIGYQVGFRDPAHFSRSFSQYFGIAPSETRK